MDLAKLHGEIKATISKLDLSKIWPGFEPLPFALFDNEKCFFDGRYVEKTDAFCANTSIVYEGEQIATWMAAEDTELPVLASKLVHEMFHGFQSIRGWDCWPNEIEALFRYGYDAENLGIRLRENELLLSMLDRFDGDALRELLSLRRLRSERFPYQFSYEIRTEEIEGAANYVEWQSLRQLDARKADELAERMRAALTAPERLFPIRISCYYSGALMINALLGAGAYSFDAAERPAAIPAIMNAAPSHGDFPGREETVRRVSEALAAYDAETDSIIRKAVERNDIALEGPLGLGFVNVYNARRRGEFITTTFFLTYRENGEDRMLPGDYVIKMLDEKTIGAVYRWI